MQRLNEQLEETIKTIPSTSASMTGTPGTTERRYDVATMQKAVEIAAQMQADHQVSLSTQEIEDIAAEAGIEPRFIRQALTQAEKETVVTQVVTVWKTEKQSHRHLARRTRFLMFGLPLLYFLLLFPAVVLLSYSTNGSWLIPMITIVPCIITVFTAVSLRRILQGAIAGLLMGLGGSLAIILGTLVNHGSAPWNEIGPIIISLLIGGTLLGAATTYLRRNLPHWIADKD